MQKFFALVKTVKQAITFLGYVVDLFEAYRDKKLDKHFEELKNKRDELTKKINETRNKPNSEENDEELRRLMRELKNTRLEL